MPFGLKDRMTAVGPKHVVKNFDDNVQPVWHDGETEMLPYQYCASECKVSYRKQIGHQRVTEIFGKDWRRIALSCKNFPVT